MGKIEEVKQVYQELYCTLRDFPGPVKPYQKGDVRRDFIDGLKSTPAVLRRSAGEMAATVSKVYNQWHDEAEIKAELAKWNENMLLIPGMDFINLVEELQEVLIKPYYWGSEPLPDLGLVQYRFKFSAWHYKLDELSEEQKLERLEDVIRCFYAQVKEVSVKLELWDFITFVTPRFQKNPPYVDLYVGMNGIGRQHIWEKRCSK